MGVIFKFNLNITPSHVFSLNVQRNNEFRNTDFSEIFTCVSIKGSILSHDGTANVYVNKELQRVDRAALLKLEEKDVLFTFPVLSERNRTQLVLKKPKTLTSVRKVFLPRTVAEMLVDWKREQDELKEALGSEYTDYDLVFAGYYGLPTEASSITASFEKLIKENDLPKVVFHSLRHSSITYKLKLNGGDIKAVQGDSGHAQAKMVTDQYSHILDDDRRVNAELFEKAFYSGKTGETEASAEPGGKTETVSPTADAEGLDPELLMKLLTDPKMAVLLKTLAQNLK